MVFEEVFGCCGVGFVERVEEGWVEGSEGKFVDYVGEVECCGRNPPVSDCAIAIQKEIFIARECRGTYHYDPNAAQTPYTHVPSL